MSLPRLRRPFAVVGLALVLASPAFAESWTPAAELRSESARVGDWLGFAVAIDGDTAMVSAHRSRACVDVYERSSAGWRPAGILPAPPRTGHQFGYSIALEGDRVVVGNDQTDAVALFERGSDGRWALVASLAPPESARRELFGRSVAMDGDVILVGASAGGERDSPPGAVHVFERDASGSWTWTNRILWSRSYPDDRFGALVALSGGTAFVAEHSIPREAPFQRVVTIFERRAPGDWAEVQRLVVSATDRRPAFGDGLAVLGDRALIGDPSETVKNVGLAGAVHEYRRKDGRWEEIAVRTAPEPLLRGGFGRDLSLGTNLAVIAESGAGYERVPRHDAVHIVRVGGDDGWEHLARIESPSGEPDSMFGSSVEVSTDAVIVGAFLAVAPPATQRDPDRGGNDSIGTAWVLEPGPARAPAPDRTLPRDLEQGRRSPER